MMKDVIVKSKLVIAVSRSGWLFFLASISSRFIRAPQDEHCAFNVFIILIPFGYTFLGNLINEKAKY
jgi:hypothetical protein